MGGAHPRISCCYLLVYAPIKKKKVKKKKKEITDDKVMIKNKINL